MLKLCNLFYVLLLPGLVFGDGAEVENQAIFERLISLENRVEVLEKDNLNLKEIISKANIQPSLISDNYSKKESVITGNKTLEDRVQHLEDLSRVKVLRSCDEYSQYGLNASGLFYIDPDGDLIGHEPIEVYCDFEEKSTQIKHDSEFIVDIPHCEGQYCYSLNITYTAPLSQIKTLMDLSERCEQEITFNCFQSALSIEDTPVGVWINRDGGQETYYVGENHGSHLCSCALNNSCSDSARGEKCNCDANYIPEVQEDSGMITDMSALPISAFWYGDLIYDSQIAQVFIGRLKCYGEQKLSPDEITNSCSNLKRDGVSTTANYILRDNNVAFCDMEKSMDDDAIQTILGKISYDDDVQNDKFYATRSSGGSDDAYLDVGTITFDATDFDSNVSFDYETGVFKASKKGLYYFDFVGHVQNSDLMNDVFLKVNVNGSENRSFYGGAYDTLSAWWYLNLNEGDEVTLNCIKSSTLWADFNDIISYRGYFIN